MQCGLQKEPWKGLEKVWGLCSIFAGTNSGRKAKRRAEQRCASANMTRIFRKSLAPWCCEGRALIQDIRNELQMKTYLIHILKVFFTHLFGTSDQCLKDFGENSRFDIY